MQLLNYANNNTLSLSLLTFDKLYLLSNLQVKIQKTWGKTSFITVQLNYMYTY